MPDYQISKKALEDIEKYIWEYGSENWGVANTQQYYKELISKFELLASNPKMTRERTEFKQPIRIHPHRSHSILYLLNHEKITIVRVLRGEMDIDTNLDD